MEHIPLIILGAGIQGLILAKTLLKRRPGLEFAILEAETFIGEHTSSRNSGVLHSGIYYQTNSLKHLLCIEGNEMWDSLACELKVEIQRCGKMIVACDLSQESRLTEIFEQGLKNSVPRLRWATKKELAKINKDVPAQRAIFSPNTGILDVSSTIQSLSTLLYKANVPLVTGRRVTQIARNDERLIITTADGKMSCDFLINCAGLGAVKMRKMLGLLDLEDHWVKGTYLKTNKRLFASSLLYPIPPKNLNGLGIHSTFDVSGVVRFGPNTEEVTAIDYSLNENSLVEMGHSVSSFFKNINVTDLHPDYCGIRPKILHQKVLYQDFWIKEHLHYIELCGIESPGLTASPAIAKYIVDRYLS